MKLFEVLRLLRVFKGGKKVPRSSFETVYGAKIDPLCEANAACCGVDRGGNAGLAKFKLLEVLTQAGQFEAF